MGDYAQAVILTRFSPGWFDFHFQHEKIPSEWKGQEAGIRPSSTIDAMKNFSSSTPWMVCLFRAMVLLMVSTMVLVESGDVFPSSLHVFVFCGLGSL
jgi:hypothetical protein